MATSWRSGDERVYSKLDKSPILHENEYEGLRNEGSSQDDVNFTGGKDASNVNKGIAATAIAVSLLTMCLQAYFVARVYGRMADVNPSSPTALDVNGLHTTTSWPLPQDLKGEKGDQGLAGPQGEPGLVGPPGAPGVPAPTCKSEPKVTPPACVKGKHGDSGRPGSRGRRGSDGMSGVIGIPGRPGIPGLDGLPGIPGDDGLPGLEGEPGDCHCHN